MARAHRVGRPRVRSVESAARRNHISQHGCRRDPASLGDSAFALSADLRRRFQQRGRPDRGSCRADACAARDGSRTGFLLAAESGISACVRIASRSVRLHHSRSAQPARTVAPAAEVSHRVLSLDVLWRRAGRSVYGPGSAADLRVDARLPDDGRRRLLPPSVVQADAEQPAVREEKHCRSRASRADALRRLEARPGLGDRARRSTDVDRIGPCRGFHRDADAELTPFRNRDIGCRGSRPPAPGAACQHLYRPFLLRDLPRCAGGRTGEGPVSRHHHSWRAVHRFGAAQNSHHVLSPERAGRRRVSGGPVSARQPENRSRRTRDRVHPLLLEARGRMDVLRDRSPGRRDSAQSTVLHIPVGMRSEAEDCFW